jgi:lysophospholipase L1-like esterase
MRNRKVFRLFATALWLLVLLLVVEVFGVVFYRVLPARSKQYDKDVLFRSVREAFHPRLWKVKWQSYEPGKSARMERNGVVHKASINSNGFRGPELPEHLENETVIACLGGSTTVLGNRNETTYPYRMGIELRRNHHIKATVLNCGVAGLLSSNYMEAAEHLLEVCTPKLVLEYNGVNDICRRIFAPARKQLPSWKRLLSRSTTAQLLFRDAFIPSDDTLQKEINRKITNNLLQVACLLHAKGSRLAVASFQYPDPEEMSLSQYLFFDQNIRYHWHTEFVSYRQYCRTVDMYNRRIRELANKNGFLYIPLSENAPLSVDHFQDICHLNEEGIAIMATTMADLVAPLIDGDVRKNSGRVHQQTTLPD